ncbi:MAG: hypothetical protein QM757_08215 [Paludibaculum sp.]
MQVRSSSPICATSLGGMPVLVDESGIDIAYSGTQKALGRPPGLAPITCSREPWTRGCKTPTVSWYLDLKLLLDYEHATATTTRPSRCSMPYESRPSSWKRAWRIAGPATRPAMKRLLRTCRQIGVGTPVAEGHRLWTLNTPFVPAGVNDMNVPKLMAEHSIEIAGGLGVGRQGFALVRWATAPVPKCPVAAGGAEGCSRRRLQVKPVVQP